MHQCQIIFILCVVVITCIHSLKPELRVDPSAGEDGKNLWTLTNENPKVKIHLPQPFFFIDRSINTIWVYRDGYISLDGRMDDSASYPLSQTMRTFKSLNATIIAPFMARVGPKMNSKVQINQWRRDDKDCRIRNTISRLEEEIHVVFPLDRKFSIKSLVVINWLDQAFDGATKEQTNTFELALLLGEKDESFVVFNYVDIKWIRAQRLGQPQDPYPLMGMAYRQQEYAFPSSGALTARNIKQTSNVATPGMWVVKTGKMPADGEFRNPDVKYGQAVLKISVTEQLRAIRQKYGFGEEAGDPCRFPIRPQPVQPRTTLKAPLAQRIKTCAEFSCKNNSRCETFSGGSCCVCKQNYYGDGKVCKNKEDKFKITGSVEINLDGKRFTGELFYQAKKDNQRSITYIRYKGQGKYDTNAVSLILPLFFTPFWYVARTENAGMDALESSGLKIQREGRATIKDVGQFTYLQTVDSVDQDGNAKWQTQIFGSGAKIPQKNIGDSIALQKPSHYFTMESKGENSDQFTVRNSLTLRDTRNMSWIEQIYLTPSCPHKKIPNALTVHYEGLYVSRPRADEVFIMASNFVQGGRANRNPCAFSKVVCPGQNEVCKIGGPRGYQCVCEEGYTLQGGRCADINECLGRNRCDPENAICVNQPGRYSCVCKVNFVGDGIICEDACANNRCDRNAFCIRRRSDDRTPYTCQCNPGFEGDGFTCRQRQLTDDCSRCDKNADCFRIPVPPQVVIQCVCKNGFIGDGNTCSRKDETRQCTQRCHVMAYCDNGVCKCKDGLTGNGVTSCVDCTSPDGPRCQRPFACYYDSKENIYRCKCKPGQKRVGDRCVAACPVPCDVNAACVNGRCLCRSGFIGNGITCRREITCQTCHQNAVCDRGTCRCKNEFVGDGVRECRFDCAVCHKTRATCTGGSCACNEFYIGDGRICEVKHQCYVDSDCEQNNECKEMRLPNNDRVRMCVCKDGYEKKNGKCTPKVEDVQLTIEPNADVTINEGDQLRFRCVIVRGRLSPAALRWSKFNGAPLRSDIRTYPDNEKRYMELIIMSARPEDSGQYVCRYGSKETSAYLKVEPNVCNRKCHIFAFCDKQTRQCTCNTNYRGDGTNSCIRNVCSNFPEMCGNNATCINDVCVCRRGYIKLGGQCKRKPDCRTLKNCKANSRCLNVKGEYQCRCNNGYTNNGTMCVKKNLGCNLMKNICTANAECIFETRGSVFKCVCKKGYYGDGSEKCEKRENCIDAVPQCKCKNCVCKGMRVYDNRAGTHIAISKCICEPGFKMVDGECYSATAFNTSLFVATGSVIYRLPIVEAIKKKSYMWHVNEVNPIRPVVVALATDCNDRRLYWSSFASDSYYLQTVQVDKPKQSSVLAKLSSSLEGLAVDWISGNIFYTASRSDKSPGDAHIGVMTKDGKYRHVIYKKNVQNPRGIVVDPMTARIYWTDWDRNNPRVESSLMDGTRHQTIVENLKYLPNGLVFDYPTRRLCYILSGPKDNWAGGQDYAAGVAELYCIRPETETTPTLIYKNETGWPYALAFNEKTFYYTDWNAKKLFSLKYGVQNIIKYKEQRTSEKPYGLTILPPTCPPGKNACSRTYNNYGGCTSLCLPVANGGRVCKSAQPTN